MEAQVKQPTTLEEQLLILSERGMKIDESLARQWLVNVSYYRMSGYWYPYRVLPSNIDPRNPVRLDKFVPGTSFSEIAGLYEFDRKLRALIHDGIERIEVALRTRINERFPHNTSTCITTGRTERQALLCPIGDGFHASHYFARDHMASKTHASCSHRLRYTYPTQCHRDGFS